ncbi:MAG: CRISPR-associated endonuclease Cas2 [Butyrivibrio sp.]
MIQLEDYFFDTNIEESHENKLYILIIYDIIDNKKRVKLAKFLQGYGFRIQKSAFEAMLTHKLYMQLKQEIRAYASNCDSIRIYKIIGKGQVTTYGGAQNDMEDLDYVII